MKIALYLVFLFSLFLTPAFSQTMFVQGTEQSCYNTGYRYPYGQVAVGVDYTGKRFLTSDDARVAFGIFKNDLGAGWGFGFDSRTYYRINKTFGVGGGAEYSRVVTPAWHKDSFFAVPGIVGVFSYGRVFLDWVQPIYSNNNVRLLQTEVELGHGRFRPMFGIGYVHYTMPYDCTTSCIGYSGATAEYGLKIMLGKMK